MKQSTVQYDESELDTIVFLLLLLFYYSKLIFLVRLRAKQGLQKVRELYTVLQKAGETVYSLQKGRQLADLVERGNMVRRHHCLLRLAAWCQVTPSPQISLVCYCHQFLSWYRTEEIHAGLYGLGGLITDSATEAQQ